MKEPSINLKRDTTTAPVRRKPSLKLILSLTAVALILINGLLVYTMYTKTDAGVIRTDSVNLELRDRDIKSFEGFERCKELERLDVRGNYEITIEQAEAFMAEQPGCTLIWSVPVGGRYFDSSLETLDLSDSGLSDVESLRCLTGLKTLDLSGNELDSEAIGRLRAELPDCAIQWSIRLGDAFYDSETTELKLEDISGDDLDKLAWFDSLESVDATGCTDYFKLAELNRSEKRYKLDWVVRMGGVAYKPDTKSIVFSKDCGADVAYLQCLDSLASVDATCCTAYDELYTAISAMPDCKFVWQVKLTNKITCPSSQKVLDLSGAQIDDFERFKTLIGYLPALTKVKMHDCSLSYEQLDELRSAYPEKGIYWLVRFWRWEVSTNAQVFSCLNKAVTYRRCTNEDLDPLRYCTELRCIDLGHNGLVNLDFLKNCTKLQVIILTDNRKLADVSALAYMPDLEYVELMTTSVTDISALSQTSSLTAVNMSNSPIKDFTPLLNHKLKYTVLGLNDCKQSHINEINKQLPLLHPKKPWYGWDTSKQYQAYKKVFTNWKEVKYYNSWEDYSIR